ncbi:MAG TPA: hypothetical protein VJO14_03320 [Bacteroidota bacterium]|nr:hypothetical protein [Bacteroidota bacterium]
MKTLMIAVFCLLLAPGADAQLRSRTMQEQSAAVSLVRPGAGLSSLFGLLNPENFLMQHTLSYNYMSAGGTGLSVASYTNSMFYKIADPLEVRMDITLQGSPFGPTAGADRNNLSKLYVSRLQMNYQPWKDVFLQLQYRESPYFFNRDFTDPFTFGHPWGDR